MTEDEVLKAVTWALESGLRLIDSAKWYENEAATSQAIEAFMKSTGTPRSEIFYTTKLMYNNGFDTVTKAIEASIALAPGGIIDLYLVHGPIGGKQMRYESWLACEAAKAKGQIRSIGVSRFRYFHSSFLCLLLVGREGRAISGLRRDQ